MRRDVKFTKINCTGIICLYFLFLKEYHQDTLFFNYSTFKWHDSKKSIKLKWTYFCRNTQTQSNCTDRSKVLLIKFLPPRLNLFVNDPLFVYHARLAESIIIIKKKKKKKRERRKRGKDLLEIENWLVRQRMCGWYAYVTLGVLGGVKPWKERRDWW